MTITTTTTTIRVSQSGHSIECIPRTGHSIVFLHFVTLWRHLTFWPNINWWATCRDGLSVTIRVPSLVILISAVLVLSCGHVQTHRHTQRQTHRMSVIPATVIGVNNNNSNNNNVDCICMIAPFTSLRFGANVCMRTAPVPCEASVDVKGLHGLSCRGHWSVRATSQHERPRLSRPFKGRYPGS